MDQKLLTQGQLFFRPILLFKPRFFLAHTPQSWTMPSIRLPRTPSPGLPSPPGHPCPEPSCPGPYCSGPPLLWTPPPPDIPKKVWKKLRERTEKRQICPSPGPPAPRLPHAHFFFCNPLPPFPLTPLPLTHPPTHPPTKNHHHHPRSTEKGADLGLTLATLGHAGDPGRFLIAFPEVSQFLKRSRGLPI